jgi:DNA end-binding protein Ku
MKDQVVTIRSMWKGSFGISLLNVPVKLGAAVSDNDLKLHQHRKSDGSRIKYVRVAEADGQEVPYSDIVKGAEAVDGSVVLLTDDDLNEAFGEKSRNAKILMFTDPQSIPRVAAGKAYVVQPDTGGEKTYALLAGSLQRTGKVAVVTIALRQRERLALIYSDGGYLYMETLEWSDDVRTPDFTAPDVEITAAEADMADHLVAAMSGDFDYSAHHDESKQRLAELVAKKAETGQAISSATPDTHSPAPDIASALEASLSALKSAQESVPEPRAARKLKAVKA